jgi:hypothetical protein
MHLPPEVWGPIFWATMHITSLGYADEPTYAEKRAAKEFFTGMQYLLPCPTCRSHFREVLQGLPIDTWLDNRKSLVEWVWMAHNQVNQRLGKSTITMDEFYKRYRDMAQRGLPIPPAAPTAEIHDATLTQSYIRGATHATGAIVAAGAVGLLLWLSYRQTTAK